MTSFIVRILSSVNTAVSALKQHIRIAAIVQVQHKVETVQQQTEV